MSEGRWDPSPVADPPPWARVRGLLLTDQKGPRMAVSLPRRLLPGALALALLTGAGLATAGCGGDEDISKEKFLADFSTKSPLDDEVDSCIVDELYAQLDQEQINDFYGSDADAPLSDENTAAVQEASAKCATESLDIPEVPDTEAPTDTTVAE